MVAFVHESNNPAGIAVNLKQFEKALAKEVVAAPEVSNNPAVGIDSNLSHSWNTLAKVVTFVLLTNRLSGIAVISVFKKVLKKVVTSVCKSNKPSGIAVMGVSLNASANVVAFAHKSNRLSGITVIPVFPKTWVSFVVAAPLVSNITIGGAGIDVILAHS